MKTSLVLVCAILGATAAQAAGYNEKKRGDLSDDGLQPDMVALRPGANVVAGKFGTAVKKDGPRTDRDYFTITVAAGQTLDAVWLDAKTFVGGAYSFIGVQSGPQVTVPPDGNSAEELLGWTHFGSGDEGRDLLPRIGAGAGAIGFKPPLGPGVYSFWVQELAECACRYRFVFELGTDSTAPHRRSQNAR